MSPKIQIYGKAKEFPYTLEGRKAAAKYMAQQMQKGMDKMIPVKKSSKKK